MLRTKTTPPLLLSVLISVVAEPAILSRGGALGAGNSCIDVPADVIAAYENRKEIRDGIQFIQADNHGIYEKSRINQQFSDLAHRVKGLSVSGIYLKNYIILLTLKRMSINGANKDESKIIFQQREVLISILVDEGC